MRGTAAVTRALTCVVVLALVLPGCGGSGGAGSNTIRVAAVYPLSGPVAVDGIDEYDGVRVAADLVNASGGVGGKKIDLVRADAPNAAAAPAAVDKAIDSGINVLIGTNGSTISLPATKRASERGALYLETGAVADSITARGLPGVLRTVATGSTLGRNAATFAHDFIMPGLKLNPASARTVVLFENDTYGSSVGYGAINAATDLGMNIVDTIPYDVTRTDYNNLATKVAADKPDVILTASYLEDALAFRRAGIGKVKVKTIVGTSSAYCRQDFGDALGADAVGLWASDKPDEAINEGGLAPAARDLLHRAEAAYRTLTKGRSMTSSSAAGFVGGWVLFHDILPHSATLRRDDLWKAAMALDLPAGSEINGAGIKFADRGQVDMGQNRRAVSVIWEWVAVGKRQVVFPPAYAQTTPRILPIRT